VLNGCKLEPALGKARLGENIQFERKGYFVLDPDSTSEHLVFNQTINLRDSWAKIAKKS
jgi:glutaminyl-tRNA synthetase